MANGSWAYCVGQGRAGVDIGLGLIRFRDASSPGTLGRKRGGAIRTAGGARCGLPSALDLPAARACGLPSALDLPPAWACDLPVARAAHGSAQSPRESLSKRAAAVLGRRCPVHTRSETTSRPSDPAPRWVGSACTRAHASLRQQANAALADAVAAQHFVDTRRLIGERRMHAGRAAARV